MSTPRPASRHRAVENLDLDVAADEFLCVLGPSGCGKSTLLSAIAGFLPPARAASRWTAGRSRGPGADRGVVFQEYALLPWMNVLDNAALGLKLRGMPRNERYEEARRFLALANLHGVEHKYPHELSGGMKQRVAVARTLANAPEVMLMDEPFAAVDAQTRMVLQEELVRICGALARDGDLHHAQRRGGDLPRRPRRGDDARARAASARSSTCRFRADERTWAALNASREFAALRDGCSNWCAPPVPHAAAVAAAMMLRVPAAATTVIARGPGAATGVTRASTLRRKLDAIGALPLAAAITRSRSTSRPSASTSSGCRTRAALVEVRDRHRVHA